MDTCNLLEKIARLKKINDQNASNLLKLGIDMNNLPSNVKATIKEFVDTQKATGVPDMDLVNLELWHVNKEAELHSLQEDILKPLQTKVRNVNRETATEEKKINALVESIDDFERDIVADEEFRDRVQEIGLVIAKEEKAITETTLPPVELDCDSLINQVMVRNTEKKLKCKNNLKKY